MAMVQAVQVENSGADPVDDITIKLNGVIVASFSATPTATEPVQLPYPLYVDSNGPLSIANSSSSITVKATYVLTSQ